MDEKGQEKKITELIADTFKFELMKSSKGYTCRICGARLMIQYSGKPINERMIDHYNGYHAKRK